MAVSYDVRDYLNATVHTKVITSMSSKGSGKVRDIRVPRFTGFVIDEIKPMKNSYYTLTLRETESRRIYYKDVVFNLESVEGDDEVKATAQKDFFGNIFAMGEGESRSTSKETRAAIREGRVIRGMSKEEVELAVGEPGNKVAAGNIEVWLYARSNGVVLDVVFDTRGVVIQAKARLGDVNSTPPAVTSAEKKVKKSTNTSSNKKNVGGIQGGTMETGSPLED